MDDSIIYEAKNEAIIALANAYYSAKYVYPSLQASDKTLKNLD